MVVNLEELNAPFPANEVSWRIGQAGKSAGGQIWAKVLAYIDNRCIMDRLDKVVGKANWKNEYAKGPEGGVLCGISIKIEGEWVTKWDGADNTDVEATKGGLSDSMKRAAVQWGIGRYLYDLGDNFAETSTEKRNGWQYANSKDAGKFYWLPPQNVLPNAKTEPLKVAGRASESQSHVKQLATEHGATTGDELEKRRAAEDEWIADCLKEVAAAESVETLTKIWKNVESKSGYVKNKVKPVFSARKAELQPQPA